MKVHPFVLESSLSQEECMRRLRATISEKGMGFFSFGDFDSQEFHGMIANDS
jgi:hypothetical protein